MKKSPKTYEAEQILRETFIYGKVHYLIKWKGYGLRDCTWEPIEHLKNVPDLIHKWKIQQIAKINQKQKTNYHKVNDLQGSNKKQSEKQKQKISKQELSQKIFSPKPQQQKKDKEGGSAMSSVEYEVEIFSLEENFQRSRQKKFLGKQNKKDNNNQKQKENGKKKISLGKIRQSQLKNLQQCFLWNEELVCRIELKDGRKVNITQEDLIKIDPKKLHKFSSLSKKEKV